MVNYIRKRFGLFKSGKIYKVNVSDITIPEEFILHPPRFAKMSYKLSYYRRTNSFESPIIVDENLMLIDGYTSYEICRIEGIKKVLVAVGEKNEL